MSGDNPGDMPRENYQDVHLWYIRRDVDHILTAVKGMATKQDIQELERRMDTFATKDELTSLRREVGRGSFSNQVKHWSDMIMKVGAAGAVIVSGIGALWAAFHFGDKLIALMQ